MSVDPRILMPSGMLPFRRAMWIAQETARLLARGPELPIREHRDSFGMCPTSSRWAVDDDGPYLEQWCSIAVWRHIESGKLTDEWRENLNRAHDKWDLRVSRWLKTSDELRSWHLGHYDGRNTEPVYRPKEVS